MIIDCHVHTCAFDPAHGRTSNYLLNTFAFRFMRWRLGLGQVTPDEKVMEAKLFLTVRGTREIDRAVILAFDAVHDADGRLDEARTHIYVKNDYAIDLCRRNPKLLFGASVHPYRKDAAAEVERCIHAGAVLLKWLPIVQDFDPSDEKCFAVYDVLAHYKLPLLSHTGGEKSLPNMNGNVASPRLLEPALKRGVTVIAAHCGTRSAWGETDYVSEFVSMAKDHENFYGDTAALNLPTRWHAYPMILNDPRVRAKLVHGSDWPIIALPSPRQIGMGDAVEMLHEENWMRRDVLIKQRLGFDAAYWNRAANILKLPPSSA
jgi:predicted TIM-barrel fold metal-dependent hydrolase